MEILKGNKKLIYIVIMGLILVIWVYYSNDSKPILPCPINYITGYYCPGCGMTRAVKNILHLNILKAIKFNIFVILLPFYLIMMKVFKNQQLKDSITIIMLIITILYGIMRNMGYFNYLK